MISKIDAYKDSLYIRFDQGGDTWGSISKLPHYKDWVKVLNYLKRRGFEIKTPEYFIKQNYGKSTHKTAYKQDIVLSLELMGSQIAIKFGNIQNFWKDMDYCFWSLTDHRATQLNYLEGKRIELEVNRLLSIFPQEKIKREDIKLSPEQKILKNKKESCHSKDRTKLDELGLEGVVFQMSEYDHSQNSTDRDKKKLECGELKYFYDYDKRLKCGRVYHNLNNMWWVLTTDDYHNVSSFNLFDYNNQPRRKQLKTEEKINRLESELRKHESNKNYLRCMAINKQIEKLKSTEKIYNVYSLKWGKWWGVNNSGYTSDKRMAGIYLESNILSSQSYYNDGVTNKAILV